MPPGAAAMEPRRRQSRGDERKSFGVSARNRPTKLGLRAELALPALFSCCWRSQTNRAGRSQSPTRAPRPMRKRLELDGARAGPCGAARRCMGGSGASERPLQHKARERASRPTTHSSHVGATAFSRQRCALRDVPPSREPAQLAPRTCCLREALHRPTPARSPIPARGPRTSRPRARNGSHARWASKRASQQTSPGPHAAPVRAPEKCCSPIPDRERAFSRDDQRATTQCGRAGSRQHQCRG